MEIVKEDILTIGDERYRVLKVMKEIDRYDSKSNRLVGEHLEVELQRMGEKSPSHFLKIYSKKAIIMEMRKQKGIIFNYTDGKEVPLDSITVEPKK